VEMICSTRGLGEISPARSEGAADVSIPASAYIEDLSLVGKMLGAWVRASLGARFSQPSARARTDGTRLLLQSVIEECYVNFVALNMICGLPLLLEPRSSVLLNNYNSNSITMKTLFLALAFGRVIQGIGLTETTPMSLSG